MLENIPVEVVGLGAWVRGCISFPKKTFLKIKRDSRKMRDIKIDNS